MLEDGSTYPPGIYFCGTQISQLCVGGNDDDCDVVEELLMTETIESTMEATEVGDMLI